MTLRSLLGLAVMNLFALGVGAGLLWGVRGWRTWWELARLAGLAYLLGVAALGVASTLVLVVGIPFSLVTVLLTGLVLAAVALLRFDLNPTWIILAAAVVGIARAALMSVGGG